LVCRKAHESMEYIDKNSQIGFKGVEDEHDKGSEMSLEGSWLMKYEEVVYVRKRE